MAKRIMSKDENLKTKESREPITSPAGSEDNDVRFTYAQIGNQPKEFRLDVGNNSEIQNSDWLETLGFEEKNGFMTLRTTSYSIEVDKEKRQIRRSDGKVVKDVPLQKIKRMLENNKGKEQEGYDR